MEMATNGMDTQNEKFVKDFGFLMSILAATIYRVLDLEHPFHSYIDKNVILGNSEELSEEDDK